MSLQQQLPNPKPGRAACPGCLFLLAIVLGWVTAAAGDAAGQQTGALGPATRPATQPADRRGGDAAGKATAVLLVTRGNYFLERALAAIGAERSATLTPQQYERAAPAGYDVVIFDNYRPEKPPVGGGSIYFGAVPAGGKLKAADEGGQAVTLTEQRARSWKRDHPILRGSDFASVYAAKVLKLEPAWDWEVLVAGTDGPLAVASRDGDGRGGACVVVAFDLSDSDWPLRSSLPVFLARSVQWLRGEGG